MTPTISLIIPAYNVSEFIADALESARQQSQPFHDIIVVDDGSTDGTGDICDEMQEGVTIIHQRNMGTYEARRTGIRAATGDYVMFLDGDDKLREDAVELVQREIRQQPNDIVLFRACRNESFLSDTLSSWYDSLFLSMDDISSLRQKLLLSAKLNSVNTKVFCRKCLSPVLNSPLEEDFLRGEDKALVMQAFGIACNVGYIDEILYYYRPNNCGSMSTAGIPRVNDLERVASWAERFILLCGLEECLGGFFARNVSSLVDQTIEMLASGMSCGDKYSALQTLECHPHVRKAWGLADKRLLRVRECLGMWGLVHRALPCLEILALERVVKRAVLRLVKVVS